MEGIQEWYGIWQNYRYHNEVNFLIFIPLFFLLRSWLIKKFNTSFNTKLENNDLAPFIQSLVNWGTFYAIVAYAIIYFKNTFWLGEPWFNIGNTPVTALTFVIPVTVVSLSVKFSNFVSRYLMRRVYSRYEMDEGMQYTFSRLLHYIIIVISVLVALPMIGFNLSVLTVFAGVAGIGIGFGMQNIVSNFISGLILLFERPIKVGDRIKINDIYCDVKHINIRSTVVRTGTNEHIIIPNSKFIENQIINCSYADPSVLETIPIGVAYGSDVRLLQKLLLAAAQEHQNVLADPPPSVSFLSFGESALNFSLFFWVSDPTLRFRVKSDLNFRINDLLQEHGVEMPFPQRDLHLRSVDTALLKNVQWEIEASDKEMI
jgi:small-conductance mechanosensitive channel